MNCPSCGSRLELSGVFPGGTVTCACGCQVRVPMTASTGSPLDQPYRAPAPQPKPVPQRPERMQPTPRCPACAAPLETKTLEGFVLSACSAGHGLFVPPDVLDAMIQHAATLTGSVPQSLAPLAAGSAPVRYVRCPVCTELMDRRLFAGASGVIVDVCEHGTWFDTGELAQALAFAASGRMTDGPTLGARADPRAARQARAAVDAVLASESMREDSEVQRATEVLEDGIDLVMLLLGIPRDYHRYQR